MSLEYADGEIGQNSLEMIPFEEQEFGDFCTGDILVSAIKARADYQCTYPDARSFAGSSTLIQQEVQNSVELAKQNIQSQTGITQDAVDLFSAPVISDAAIAGAPNAKAVGSQGAESPFTQRQVDAANHDPINWAGTLTIQAAMQRTAIARRNQQLSRQAVTRRNALGVPVGNAGQQTSAAAGRTPFPVWGSASGSRAGWCGVGGSPWGKLLLFTGLGLIGASFMERK